MSTIFDIVIWILSAIWGVVWWLLWQLIWILVWFLLPFALAAFIAVRIAEKALGQEVVRAWLKAQSMKLGAGVWDKVGRGLFAVSVLPFRVLGWLALYALWHSVINLFWRPRWTPWDRAWEKRWKPKAANISTPRPSRG